MSLKLSCHSIAAVSLLITSTLSSLAFAQTIRSEVEPNGIMECHDAIFYNNSNRNVSITYDYEYKGANGSHHSNRRTVVAGAGQKTKDYMPGHSVDCRQRYTVRVTNYQWR